MPGNDVLEALSRITAAELSPEDFAAFGREIAEVANPRGAAILLAVQLEEALQFALSHRLRIGSHSRTDVFGYDSPMGTFDRKIRVAHAVKLVSDETRRNLDIIRRIRNAFAHAIVPISFETQQVVGACELLKIPPSLPPTSGPVPSLAGEAPARFQYRAACETIGHNLLVAGGAYVMLISGPPRPPPETV
jgi:hypothetical protein